VFIFVERNLGFEAEHHKRALDNIPGCSFYVDEQAKRVGVCTTEQIKHAMCQLVVSMLSERRLHVLDPLMSNEPKEMRQRAERTDGGVRYQLETGRVIPFKRIGWPYQAKWEA